MSTEYFGLLSPLADARPISTSFSKKMSTGPGAVPFLTFSTVFLFCLRSLINRLYFCLFLTCSCMADGDSEYAVGSGRSSIKASSASDTFLEPRISDFMILVRLCTFLNFPVSSFRLLGSTNWCSGSKSLPVFSSPFTGTFLSPITGACARHFKVYVYCPAQYLMVISSSNFPKALGLYATTMFWFCKGANLPFMGVTSRCGTRWISKSKDMLCFAL
mmetsp:Transcript_30240/g.69540  ORF Transcript_30240/g.69540 Transcript_30240/m.69540 type:complete len:217 (+) Transcript_30240:6929-7579(+)